MMKDYCKAFKERLQSNPWLEAVFYFVAALALISILIWYFLVSDFGAPPEFVYNQF